MSIATSPLAWQFTWMPARCTRSTHSFSVVLCLGDVPFVRRRHAGIRRAERHGALRERAVDGVLRRRAELDPLVAETGLDAGGDHRLERAAARLVADAMQQIAAGADVLHRLQVAALMVHARQAVARELLRDVRDAVTRALLDLRRREGGSRADLVERSGGEVRDAAVQLALLVLVERAAHRIGRGPW